MAISILLISTYHELDMRVQPKKLSMLKRLAIYQRKKSLSNLIVPEDLLNLKVT